MTAHDDYVRFGKKLTALRLARGYNQSQFARLLDIPATTLSGYENGTRKAPLSLLKKAARALQVTTDELLEIS